MAECRLCGIDINEEGLCNECKNEYGKRSIKQVFIKASTRTRLFFIGACLLVFFGLVLFFQITLHLEAQVLEDASMRLKNKQAYTANAAIVEGKIELHYDIIKETNLVPIDNYNDYFSWMTKNMVGEKRFHERHWNLSRQYIESNELVGDEVIRAFIRTPREDFVRKVNENRAYDDTWLPIGYGATITDPDVVSMMTTSLEVKPYHKVLEIGTGSGYQSAILSHLSNYVFTIEIIAPLAIETDQLYKSLEDKYPMYKNIKRKLDDGFYGWEQYAPFDRIIITCAIDHVPPPLIKQLAIDGIIVAPLGPPGRQQIMQLRKLKSEDNKISITRRDVYNGLGVKFIPFRDKEGVTYSGR